ncbi:Mediator of RNA polymerase II transcription subunit 16 [Rhizina undulata]
MGLPMEAGFGVEDLFRDEATHQRYPHRRIEARMDELRLGGCNSKIVWSKLGCIAMINAEGTGVETRHLACNPEDGRWLLSDAYPIANVSRFHEGQQLRHVAWNSQAELAVVDVLGRVSFYTVFLAVNHLNVTRHQILDQDDDLSALVGFWWLPAERPYAIYRPAMRSENGNFKYQALRFSAYGPFHPLQGKVAAMGVTRGGTLKMWYQDPQNRYLEVTAELEGFSSSDDLFSHAAISWNKDHVAVLAAYTLSKQLRVYRVAINWNLPPQQPNQPITQLPHPPNITIRHVKVKDSAVPAESTTHDVSKAQLTHFEMLGPTPGPPNIPNVPGVLAVFSSETPDGQPSSIVCRWNLKESAYELHPSFTQLGVRRASVTAPTSNEIELQRMDDVFLNKCVISVSQVTSGTVIAMAFSDGSLDMRDRYTFNSLQSQSRNKDVVMNMVQAGFAFPPGEPCIDLAPSSNNAVAIRLGHDHDVHLMVMEYTHGPMDENENLEIACVALAHQHAYSCNNHSNNDDLLLVAQKYRSPIFNVTFLSEAHTALGLKMDFASESPGERLIRNPLLQRCLSLQNALDFQGEGVNKRLSGKLAWATLHLRVASLAFALTFNNPPRQAMPGGTAQGGLTEFDLRPEALQTLLGLVRWLMDMMSLIISDLFELAKATKGRTNDLKFVRQKVLEGNSPALFLTLASAPRALLRYNCRSLRGLENSAIKQLQQQGGLVDEEQKITLKSLKVPIESSAVKISQFERIMTDIDGTIRAAYNNILEADRAAAEKTLFVNNEIPPIFAAAVERLLTTTIPSLRNDIDVATLHWHDVTWLCFHDDISSQEYRRKNRIDAIRKVVLPQGDKVKLRRCTRCCAIVEDIVPMKSPSYWLSTMQRMCFCGTLWMHMNGGH